jgi:branched-chain amino acid transport system ATP-binding protein
MLKLTNLYAGYGAVDVLKDVSIEVNEGEFVAIVGPNGAGKTTLFKAISGLVTPSRGNVYFAEHNLLKVSPHQRAHLGIAHVPEGRQVFPSLTILENLALGASTASGQRDWNDNLEKIFSWFPVLKIRQQQRAGSLSGGEQQMLAIGRGIAASPRLLLLDEPSMGLSPLIADEISERLVEIHRSSKLSVLLVEQRVAEALHYANRGYVLETGRVVLSGSQASLQQDDRIRQVYLGM